MKYKTLLVAVLSLLVTVGSLFAQSTPPAPTNLIAQSMPMGGPAVTLSWQAQMGFMNFKIYRSLADSTHFAAIGTTSMQGFRDQNVEAGRTYYYSVKTFIVQGGITIESPRSNIAGITLTGGMLTPKGTITGTVRSDSSNLPIPYVRISFFRFGGVSMMNTWAFTDSLGRYQARLDTGRYLIKADPMGGCSWQSPYQPEWFDNAPDPSTATPVRVLRDSVFVANFGLAPRTLLANAYVSGRVTDTLGVPLRNASVALMRPMQEMNLLYSGTGMMPGLGEEMMDMEGVGSIRGMMWNGRTDSLGNYRARVIAGRLYIALASKVGYVPEYFNNKRNPLEADIIFVQRDTTGINFSLSLNPVYQNSISGIVRDSLGTQVPSRIVLYPARVIPGSMGMLFGHTDSLGVYTISNIPTGKYFVFAAPFSAYAPAFYKAGRYGVRRWQDADTVNITGNVTAINIGVVPIGTSGYAHVGGRVRTSSNTPLAGVNLVATSSPGEVVGYGLTDGTGSYAMDAVAAGTVTLSVDRIEYNSTSGTANITSNTFSTDNVDFVLSPASPTAVDESGSIPASYTLEQNYPNPFNPSTTIGFNIPASSRVNLKIFNLLGQEVVSLVNGELAAGTHAVLWNGKDNAARSVASGLYFYKLTATSNIGGQEFTQIRKMVLMK